MLKNTSFSELEKLSVLKIMIMIRNHYSLRLPEGLEFIRKTAILFQLSNGILDAYDLPEHQAMTILAKAFTEDVNKRTDFSELLSFMLHSSRYGVFNELHQVSDRDDYDFKINLLGIELKKEWDYVFKLVGNIIPKNDKDLFTDLLLLLGDKNRNPFDDYSNNDTCESKDNLLADFNNTISERMESSSNKQDILEKDNQTRFYKHLDENIKQTSNRIENVNEISNLDSIKDELRKELEGFVRKELKEFINTELKEFVSREIREGIQQEMKNIMHDNFNETLYKDL